MQRLVGSLVGDKERQLIAIVVAGKAYLGHTGVRLKPGGLQLLRRFSVRLNTLVRQTQAMLPESRTDDEGDDRNKNAEERVDVFEWFKFHGDGLGLVTDKNPPSWTAGIKITVRFPNPKHLAKRTLVVFIHEKVLIVNT